MQKWYGVHFIIPFWLSWRVYARFFAFEFFHFLYSLNELNVTPNFDCKSNEKMLCSISQIGMLNINMQEWINMCKRGGGRSLALCPPFALCYHLLYCLHTAGDPSWGQCFGFHHSFQEHAHLNSRYGLHFEHLLFRVFALPHFRGMEKSHHFKGRGCCSGNWENYFDNKMIIIIDETHKFIVVLILIFQVADWLCKAQDPRKFFDNHTSFFAAELVRFQLFLFIKITQSCRSSSSFVL